MRFTGSFSQFLLGKTGITVNNEQFEQHYFEPKSEGFYSITVIDEAGQTDTAKIKVEFR